MPASASSLDEKFSIPFAAAHPHSGVRRIPCVSSPIPKYDADPITALWISGDRRLAVAAAFRTERQTLYNIARRVLGDHVASDVVQEVFLKLWTHPERFDPTRGTLGVYLRMTTKSVAIDHLRLGVSRARRDLRRDVDSDFAADPLQLLVARDCV